jgi:hypothetical protein
MSPVPSLAELEERRARECRLTPDRALQSLDEAEAFLGDRGLLTRTPGCALPSLFEACHEDPYAPGRGGFGDWPRTKWWWAGALEERRGVYALKIHRGKTLLLSEETAALVDPICRSELERLEAADEGWAKLLQHLAEAGPSLLEDVQRELDLKPKELKAQRSPLERCGALVARQLVLETAGGGHQHTSELARWDQVFTRPAAGTIDLAALVLAGVRAAVVAPDHEPRRWFSWVWRWEDDLVERLIAEGRLFRPEPGRLAVPD